MPVAVCVIFFGLHLANEKRRPKAASLPKIYTVIRWLKNQERALFERHASVWLPSVNVGCVPIRRGCSP